MSVLLRFARDGQEGACVCSVGVGYARRERSCTLSGVAGLVAVLVSATTRAGPDNAPGENKLADIRSSAASSRLRVSFTLARRPAWFPGTHQANKRAIPAGSPCFQDTWTGQNALVMQ
jgi:hypothetical protein